MSRTAFFSWGVALFLPILHFLLHVGFGLGGWAPDLLTVGLLVLAREVRVGTAAGVGFAFGLLEDAFSIVAFGANTVALTIVGILGARSRDLFIGESVLFLGSYLLVGTWLRVALHWVVSGDAARGEVLRVLVAEAPVTAAYAAVVGIVLILVSGGQSREVRV